MYLRTLTKPRFLSHWCCLYGSLCCTIHGGGMRYRTTPEIRIFHVDLFVFSLDHYNPCLCHCRLDQEFARWMHYHDNIWRRATQFRCLSLWICHDTMVLSNGHSILFDSRHESHSSRISSLDGSTTQNQMPRDCRMFVYELSHVSHYILCQYNTDNVEQYDGNDDSCH